MFGIEFYPTPPHVIDLMLEGLKLEGKTAWEPSAGNGNIVDRLKQGGAEVIACEIDADLRAIVSRKCQVIANDCLQVTAEQISHVSHIVMNPPFSKADRHILHAYEIAPPGCKIIALCNGETLSNTHSRSRSRLKQLVDDYGHYTDLGNCFEFAQRKTEVTVALVVINKPGGSYETEFEGFFTEEEQEDQFNGIMPYNAVRDLVNRYCEAIRIHDEVLAVQERLNEITAPFYSNTGRFTYSEEARGPKDRATYKKDLQKDAWKYVFNILDMDKYATQQLRADINKFVERQTNIPFTMRNIYRMLEIVIGTHDQRMNKALEEVFDKLTRHYHENRYQVEGWKTNSHYLINEKFILPWLVEAGFRGQVSYCYNGNYGIIEDMHKALAYMFGHDLNSTDSFCGRLRDSDVRFGEWFDWGFFEVKCFKKGTGHFKFKDSLVWRMYNEQIAKIKGYPLYEATKKPEAKQPTPAPEPVVHAGGLMTLF